MIDALATARGLLLENSAVGAVVGMRVSVSELKPSEHLDWQTPEDVTDSIVVQTNQGDEYNIESPRIDVEIDLICLANSSINAMALARVIYDEFQGDASVGIDVMTPNVTVLSVVFPENPIVEVDPNTNWHFARLKMDLIILE